MARFTARVQVGVGVERVWARITDWPRHGGWVPLTKVTVTSPRPDGLGAVFVGRTGLGPLGFDDPMEVVAWTPPEEGRPGYCKVRKLGRVVLGWAEFTVEPADGGSSVRWTEDIELVPVRLTSPFAGLIATAGRLGFGSALRKMARELEQEEEGVSGGG
jgi:hypothetical protein